MTTYTPKTKQAPADTAALPRDLAAALTTALGAYGYTRLTSAGWKRSTKRSTLS